MAAPIPFSRLYRTELGLARWIARLAGACAAVPLLDLFLDQAFRGLEWERRSWSLDSGTDATFFVVAMVLGAASAAVGGFAMPWFPSGALRIGKDDLRLASPRRKLRIARTSVRQGHVAETERGTALALHVGGGARLDLVMSQADADRTLAALHLGPESKRVTMRLGSAVRPLVYGGAGILLGPLVIMWTWAIIPFHWVDNAALPPAMFALSLALMVLFARLTAPAELTVGSDGLAIRHRLRRRFIPHAHISSVYGSRNTLGIDLTRPGGETERLTIDGEGDQVTAALRRIRLAGTADGATEDGGVMDTLDPEGKSVETWLSSLRALVRPGQAGYRRAAVSTETLVEVLGRPDVDVRRRIGAAIALKASGDERAAARIRAAAESVAGEDARAALEAIASEEAVSEEVVRRVGGKS